MKNKRWFIINDRNEIITKMFTSYEKALEVWEQLTGEIQICETIYG